MFSSAKEENWAGSFPAFSAVPWAQFLHFHPFSAQRTKMGGRGLRDAPSLELLKAGLYGSVSNLITLHLVQGVTDQWD